jgi:hypothetical protein
MNSPHTHSQIEKIGGSAILALLAVFALYVGVSAMITGQFFESGYRSNPTAVLLVTGLRAYTAGAFVASVGATFLVLLLRGKLPKLALPFFLFINTMLFLAAVLSNVFSK